MKYLDFQGLLEGNIWFHFHEYVYINFQTYENWSSAVSESDFRMLTNRVHQLHNWISVVSESDFRMLTNRVHQPHNMSSAVLELDFRMLTNRVHQLHN